MLKRNIIVKFVNRGSKADEETQFRNQLPNDKACWGMCQFTFNPLVKNYDWLVIIDDVPKILKSRVEELRCPKENTILITTEPETISRYGRAFAKQFHYLITNHPKEVLPHPNPIRSQTGNVWLYWRDFDTVISMLPPMKTKKISTVCSNKQHGHTMHKLRYQFTQRLEQEIPIMERFGFGYKWIATKAEVIDDYEFHVAIENHIGKDVWTEKLADAFLGFSVPIYCGCPNIYEYFPEDSVILIDIHDIEGSIQKIKTIISTPGEYERRLPAVIEARRRIIEEYNIFAMINKIVENSNSNNVFTSDIKIYNRRIMRVRYLPDLFRLINFRIMNFVKSLS